MHAWYQTDWPRTGRKRKAEGEAATSGAAETAMEAPEAKVARYFAVAERGTLHMLTMSAEPNSSSVHTTLRQGKLANTLKR